MLYTICATLYNPEYQTVLSSDGNTSYTLLPKSITTESICSCPSFKYNGGPCKHIKEYESSRCTWKIEGEDEYKNCPNCGSHIIIWQSDPEYI